MKRSILLFTAVAGFFYLILTSYEDGPGAGGLGNRTGSSGGAISCGDNNCHGANNTLTNITMSLTDLSGGNPAANHYIPGNNYKVLLTVMNGNAIKYGFQATIAKAVNQQAGTITPGPGQHAFSAGSGSTLITGTEHAQPITATSGSAGIQFDWAAPVTGGVVTIYTIVNATNGNGSLDGNDHATPKTFVLQPQAASVSELSKDIKIVAYPNPASDRFSLKFEDAVKGNYSITVIDLTGGKMYADNVAISGTQASTSIETSGWANGLYFAQVMKDGAQRMIPVVKQ